MMLFVGFLSESTQRAEIWDQGTIKLLDCFGSGDAKNGALAEREDREDNWSFQKKGRVT